MAKAKRIVSHIGDTTFYRFDSQLGFWGVPRFTRAVSFYQQRDAFVDVSHNSHGNRDGEFESEAGARPIVCLGSSHTWGAGVERHLRYTDRMQERQGRRVVNLGHCSLGLDQVYLALERWADFYRPFVAVVEQCPWSIHRVLNNYVNGYVRPHFYLDSRQELKLRKTPYLARFKSFRKIIGLFYAYRKELREFKAGINLKEGYDPLADPIFLYWKASYYDAMYLLVEQIVTAIRDLCREKEIKLLFALGTISQQFGPPGRSRLVDYDLPRIRLRQILDQAGIAWVDMTEPMLREHSVEDPVVFADGHINARGHDVFARVVEAELGRRGWLKT